MRWPRANKRPPSKANRGPGPRARSLPERVCRSLSTVPFAWGVGAMAPRCNGRRIRFRCHMHRSFSGYRRAPVVCGVGR